MTTTFPRLALAAALSLAAASPARADDPAAPAGRMVFDRIAATVNGEIITLRELQERAGEAWRRADQLPPGPERDMSLRLALRRAYETLLSEKLFHAQVISQQLEIGEPQVDTAIEDIKKRNRFDDRQLDALLIEQGLDRAGFRAQIRRELESMQLLGARVRSRIKISDEDLRNYYQLHQRDFQGEEELHVQHILLPLAEDAPAAEVQRASALAEKVLQRLKTGEQFSAVARDVSRGPGAEDGGDLGWLRRGTIQRALEDVAFPLKDGEVSKPVRLGPGLHVFKVLERRRGGGKTYEQAKDEIREVLAQEQTASYREQYLSELKRDAVIELNLSELKD